MAAAEASTSPAELARVATLRELMAQGAGEVLAAERAYLTALERFERADARCAGALRTLADDRLADTWQYDAIKTAAGLATSAASAASLVARSRCAGRRRGRWPRPSAGSGWAWTPW